MFAWSGRIVVHVDKGPTPQYVSEWWGLRHSEPMLRAAQLSSAFACGAAAKPAKTTATAARMVVTALRFEPARRSMRPASLLDDAARLKGTSDVAHPVWPVATQNGQLTARRLVITFVPTTGGNRSTPVGRVRRLNCRARVPIGQRLSPR